MSDTADRHRSFILENLLPAPVPLVPEISLYTAHPRSGLRRHAADSPYFAYPWPGGIAIARHLLDRPSSLAGTRVFDLGTGSGLAGIAAARRGVQVVAVDVDPLACAAARLNAERNEVRLEVVQADALDGAPPAADLILAGDLFYAPRLARRAAAFLRSCADDGIDVLVGDPGRRDLPLPWLTRLSSVAVPDVGGGAAPVEAAVYAFLRQERR